jgi:hypothetical protein
MHYKGDYWVNIKSYEGIYMVNNKGDILMLDRFVKMPNGGGYRIKKRLVKQQTCKHGYKRVGLSSNGAKKMFYVHRIVINSFEGEHENKDKLWVNHKNGIKNDNRLSNLEWCTKKENTKHAYANGLVKINKGEDSIHAVLSASDIFFIRDVINSRSMYQYEIAKIYNLHPSTISHIITKRNWRHL